MINNAGAPSQRSHTPWHFPGSISACHVRVTVLKRHGFYCNIYILISSTRGRFISRPMQNSVRARARRDQRNIYLAIRTCNNSGYSAARADRCTASSVRLCSLSLVWFPPEYFTPMTRHPLLREFFDKSSEQRVERNRSHADVKYVSSDWKNNLGLREMYLLDSLRIKKMLSNQHI